MKKRPVSPVIGPFKVAVRHQIIPEADIQISFRPESQRVHALVFLKIRQHRHAPEGETYYRVTPRQRWITGIAYIALAALLTLGMSGSFVERDI